MSGHRFPDPCIIVSLAIFPSRSSVLGTQALQGAVAVASPPIHIYIFIDLFALYRHILTNLRCRNDSPEHHVPECRHQGWPSKNGEHTGGSIVCVSVAGWAVASCAQRWRGRALLVPRQCEDGNTHTHCTIYEAGTCQGRFWYATNASLFELTGVAPGYARTSTGGRDMRQKQQLWLQHSAAYSPMSRSQCEAAAAIRQNSGVYIRAICAEESGVLAGAADDCS